MKQDNSQPQLNHGWCWGKKIGIPKALLSRKCHTKTQICNTFLNLPCKSSMPVQVYIGNESGYVGKISLPPSLPLNATSKAKFTYRFHKKDLICCCEVQTDTTSLQG